MDKKLKKYWGSKCEKDYKKKHYWEKLGIILDSTKLKVKVYLIWRCSQCQKCIREELDFLD